MAKILIVYFSKTGNSKKMAQAIREGACKTVPEVEVIDIENANTENLTNYQAVIVGSPTHYGKLAAPMNDFLIKTLELKEKLKGKIGGVFTSYGVNIEGAEITIITVVQILLEHGMIVPGYNLENPFGQLVAGTPDEQIFQECYKYGNYIAELTRKLTA